MFLFLEKSPHNGNETLLVSGVDIQKKRRHNVEVTSLIL